MTESHFCTACGTPIADGNAFCTGCGAQVKAPPATQTPAQVLPAPTTAPVAVPAPASGEQILTIIGGLTLVAGFMGLKQKSYTLIITERRLVFAELTKDKITAAVNAARDQAKAEGKGFFGQWGAQIGSTMTHSEAYWQMSPDAALAETPGNWVIERSQFQGAKFRIGATDENTSSPDVLIIKAATGKWKFNVQGSLSSVKKRFKEAGLA
ncbi:MAG: zinc ribbon domain-containing protein [Coriobacteriia bacterium]|nr:zinc ribbon domain-containing protein [Coriobacteriia bacterium]